MQTADDPTVAVAVADEFEAFVRDVEPALRRALVATFGFDEGRDAAAEALAYAWEHWDKLRAVANLPGYLYRVGKTKGSRRTGITRSSVQIHAARGLARLRASLGIQTGS